MELTRKRHSADAFGNPDILGYQVPRPAKDVVSPSRLELVPISLRGRNVTVNVPIESADTLHRFFTSLTESSHYGNSEYLDCPPLER